MNIKKAINIKADWDEKANVWVAASDNMQGLTTEAETMEQLIKNPEPLSLNCYV